MRKVKVRWTDSMADNPYWIDRDQFVTKIDDGVMESIGYVLHDDAFQDMEAERWFIIAQSIASNQYGGVFRIPRQCIVDIEELDGADKVGE